MEDEAAVIPLYMGMPGEEKQGLNKTCSYYWCVNKFASEDDKEAAEQFLYWLVTSKTGIQIMTRNMGFQIPYRKAEVPENSFIETLHEEEEAGHKPISQYYKYGKYTTWTNNMMNALHEYVVGTGGWTEVKDALITLW